MNMITFPRQLIIISTTKSVGKTFVATTLMMGLRALYWKPIQCGISPCTDTEWIHETTGLPSKHFLRESYLYHKETLPCAQHTQVDLDSLHPRLTSPYEHMIIEGPGGIMVPLNEEDLFLDFIKKTKAPIMLVMSQNNSCIDHAILTIEKLKEEHIPLFSVVVNKSSDKSAFDIIKHHSGDSHLIHIDFLEHITEKNLIYTFQETFAKREQSPLTSRRDHTKIEKKLKFMSL